MAATARIFISYRRADTAGYAGRLDDRLTAHFGQDQIFRDIDTIKPGVDFTEVLREAVASCHALIALIGKDWLTEVDEEGRRRLDNPDDFVRLEISAALERDVLVIPALVAGGAIPRASELPADLAPLSRRNALTLSDERWDYDVGVLIQALDEQLGTPSVAEGEPSDAGLEEADVHERESAPWASTTDTGEHVRWPRKAREAIRRIPAWLVIVSALVIVGGLVGGGIAISNSKSPGTASGHLGDRTLSLVTPHVRGVDVTELQRLLTGLGFPAALTGDFDRTTATAVGNFQTCMGLSSNSTADRTTVQTLERASSEGIIGSSGDDTLEGTNGEDMMFGLAGNDRIDGFGGNDIICGGEGDDVLSGGTGNDQVLGGPGNDTLNGGDGNDALRGGEGNDTIHSGTGVDTVAGGGGVDTCAVQPGDTAILCES